MLDFQRKGSLNFRLYIPNPSGTTIATPVAPTVAPQAFTSQVFVKAGGWFNLSRSTPLTTRTVKTAFGSYNIDGHLNWTAFSPAATLTLTPATHNGFVLTQTAIPKLCAYIAVSIDGIVNIYPTLPDSRLGTPTLPVGGFTQNIAIFTEPSSLQITEGEINDNRETAPPKEFKAISFGPTTDKIMNNEKYSKIEIKLNDLPDQTLVTNSSGEFKLTLSGPAKKYQALFNGGSAYISDGVIDAPTMISTGIKAGTCSDPRILEITEPGDNCNSFYNTLFYAQAISGEDLSLEAGSESVINLPVTFKQMASAYFKGQHALNYMPV